ncbi:MAG: hypothetical protein KBC56_07260 [Flavobacterium sp.]|nr:hypothetical protein [Flavobacterium sp.]
MENNTIRKVSIGKDMSSQFHYVIGSTYSLKKKDETIRRELTNIEETETRYILYVTADKETQRWKDLPKNDETTHEYDVD